MMFIRAYVPEELIQKLLQHLRDFDIAHPGCHFETLIEAPKELSEPLEDIIKRLQVEPQLTVTKVFNRRRQ